ncbi:hypothetical protein [Mucilaginibacter polytrichastri]|nr:hypothetical protein [Mucilaginibacter polytrichastri]SFS91859.1 hypothetical protein SAMN04487890_106130 [Mucilaginibacter polytrichastri]
MKKAILPSKTYLVCSSGMRKTELEVISQLTVFNDSKNRKIATIDDRFGDFICKYALIVGAFVAAAIFASGGSLAFIIGVALIAGLASLSMCFIVNLFNSGGWKNPHPTAFIGKEKKKNLLTDKSYFSCPIGGTIIPVYDEKIASRQAEIFRDKAITEIFMSAVGGYFAGGFAVASIAAQASFGTVASGFGVGYLIGVGVSTGEDAIKDAYYGKLSKEEEESPLHHEEGGEAKDLSYVTPKMTGDENTVETITKAKELSEDKQNIIDEKVDESLSSNTGRNGGLLKNDPKKAAKIARDNGKLSNKEYLKLRRDLEAKQIKDLKNTEGVKGYRGEQLKNIKESGSRFLDGFSLKTSPGKLFWAATLTELISNLITEKMQRNLYDDSIDAEAEAKKALGVYAQK